MDRCTCWYNTAGDKATSRSFVATLCVLDCVLFLSSLDKDSFALRSFVRSSEQILLPRYLMHGLNNFDKTCRKYLLAPADIHLYSP